MNPPDNRWAFAIVIALAAGLVVWNGLDSDPQPKPASIVCRDSSPLEVWDNGERRIRSLIVVPEPDPAALAPVLEERELARAALTPL